jgi:hypothetical protein
MPTVPKQNTGRSSQFADYSPTALFVVPGTLTTTDNDKIPWIPGRGSYFTTVTGQVKTASTGADITVDISLITRATGLIDGSVLGTLTIPAGSLVGTITIPNTLVDTFHALAAAITQIGSGTAGANLTIEVY